MLRPSIYVLIFLTASCGAQENTGENQVSSAYVGETSVLDGSLALLAAITWALTQAKDQADKTGEALGKAVQQAYYNFRNDSGSTIPGVIINKIVPWKRTIRRKEALPPNDRGSNGGSESRCYTGVAFSDPGIPMRVITDKLPGLPLFQVAAKTISTDQEKAKKSAIRVCQDRIQRESNQGTFKLNHEQINRFKESCTKVYNSFSLQNNRRPCPEGEEESAYSMSGSLW